MRQKIFNDPIYGFISVSRSLELAIVDHPYFQRLRRIQQLGLTSLVYTSATHTRFAHALGAYHLMEQALLSLRAKGFEISDTEFRSAQIAILLHDIGHGPFSHTLENTIITGVSHEQISLRVMEVLNNSFEGQLETAISIFNGTYPKKFLSQLVSGQLDVDRLDYLNRDSFFTGVSEGVIGYDRILKMLNLKDGKLVVESKGIYSIEKFLVSRRLMYWQVYLHKTVISAEALLTKILERAKRLAGKKDVLTASKPLNFFLTTDIDASKFQRNDFALAQFMQLDDFDILSAIKDWCNNEDKVLSMLCNRLLNRDLLRATFSTCPIDKQLIKDLTQQCADIFNLSEEDCAYLVFTDKTTNSAYDDQHGGIEILKKSNKIVDYKEATDNPGPSVMASPVVKYYLCYPKEIGQVVV